MFETGISRQHRDAKAFSDCLFLTTIKGLSLKLLCPNFYIEICMFQVSYIRTCNMVFPHGEFPQLSALTKYRLNKITLSKLSLKHLLQTKLFLLYYELKLLKLRNIFRLKVLKLMCKFKTNSLPK